MELDLGGALRESDPVNGSAAWLLGSMLAIATPVSGAITAIEPFQGTASESFDHLGLTSAQQQIRLFGGTALVSNLTQRGALKLERSSSLNGVAVAPRSAPLMMGQLGVSEWVFDTPLTSFGGYFENNSRFDDATVEFYSVSNKLIGSVTATIPKTRRAWTWNGWQSDVPIHRIVITGNDAAFYHGFIWFDDMQIASAVVAQTDERKMAGKWAADSRTKGGLATLLIFSDDGEMTNIFGALVDFKYQVEGDTINVTFTDAETGKAEKSSKPYKIIGNKLIENPADPTNRVEMTRVGAGKPDAPAIVGVWTYKHYAGAMATLQYTSGGLAQLSVPMQISAGRYEVLTNELTMRLEGQHPTSSKRKFLLSGDHLVLLEDATDHEQKFTRVVP